ARRARRPQCGGPEAPPSVYPRTRGTTQRWARHLLRGSVRPPAGDHDGAGDGKLNQSWVGSLGRASIEDHRPRLHPGITQEVAPNGSQRDPKPHTSEALIYAVLFWARWLQS